MVAWVHLPNSPPLGVNIGKNKYARVTSKLTTFHSIRVYSLILTILHLLRFQFRKSLFEAMVTFCLNNSDF